MHSKTFALKEPMNMYRRIDGVASQLVVREITFAPAKAGSEPENPDLLASCVRSLCHKNGRDITLADLDGLAVKEGVCDAVRPFFDGDDI